MIVSGAMLGKLVVESGAAQRIADTIVAAFGERRMGWAMAVTGFIVGIPLFYGVGFVRAWERRSRHRRLLRHESKAPLARHRADCVRLTLPQIETWGVVEIH